MGDGIGNTAIFWLDRWLDGEAPCCLAPDIFKLARFKKITVREALLNGRWMQGLQRMNNEVELSLFVNMLERVQLVDLTTTKDMIG